MKTFKQLRDKIGKSVVVYHPIKLGIYSDKIRNKYHEINVGLKDIKKQQTKSLKEATILKDEDGKETQKHTDLHDKLAKHYIHSKEHGDALHSYSSEFHTKNLHSAEINHALRRPDEVGISKQQHEHINTLDHALSRHKTPQKLIVHSGVPHHEIENLKSKHKKGETLKAKHLGYTSTSLVSHVARHHASEGGTFKKQEHTKSGKIENHASVLDIHVPKGHHGSYIAHHSSFDEEREFLLPRNTKLHIHPKPKVYHHHHKGGITVYHHYSAKVVHHNEEDQ